MREISDEDAKFATKMFSRRHVSEHNAGVADQKYLDESGDNSVMIGEAIRETSENATRLGPVPLEMMSNIDVRYYSVPFASGPARKALCDAKGLGNCHRPRIAWRPIGPKERGRPVPHVVVGATLGLTRSHRSTRKSAHFMCYTSTGLCHGDSNRHIETKN